MIPAYISDEVKSNGEKQIFSYFETDPDTKSWVVLHSLNLSEHLTRRYGEVDFIVLAPKLGIFCLEVKAGGVKRKEGVWYFVNRFGREERSSRSPFQQVREGMFAIKEAIKKKYGASHRLNKILFDWGVMFPNVNFREVDTEAEAWQIYDIDSRRVPISRYINLLAENSQEKARKNGRFNEQEAIPTVEDIEEFVSFLRGDFELFISPKERLEGTEKQLHAFTQEQYRCLDQLVDNHRCLIQGAAGTGKTMLALESARREIAKNKKVLFVSYNNLLGNWLSEQVSAQNGSYIGSFHSFLINIVGNIGDAKDSKEFFETELPRYALEKIKTSSTLAFDKLIIDEGQDLIKPSYLSVFDSLLSGGLSKGKWEIFCDFERQAIYTKLSPQEMVGLLEEKSNFAKFRLIINCRNTKQIGEEISLLCNLGRGSYLSNKLDGPAVEYYFYENKEEQLVKLNEILDRLKTKKIPAHKITILSTYRYENSVIGGGNANVVPILKLDKQSLFSRTEAATFSTIHGFKGMENSFIILADIEKLQGDEVKEILYVGMSRAKVGLFVMINKNLKSVFDGILEQSISERIKSI